MLEIQGEQAKGSLKLESIMQRVPVTEAGGRVHTSTATVVMPK